MTDKIDYSYVYGEGLDVVKWNGRFIVMAYEFPWETCDTHDEAIAELSKLSAFPKYRERAKAYAMEMLYERKAKAESRAGAGHAAKISNGFRSPEVERFFDERLALVDGAVTLKDDVYDAYAAWSADPKSRQSFLRSLVQHLSDIGAEVFSSRVKRNGKSLNVFKGIAIK